MRWNNNDGEVLVKDENGADEGVAQANRPRNDRSRMKLQSKKDSNKQGGKMSKYSKDMKKEYGLD